MPSIPSYYLRVDIDDDSYAGIETEPIQVDGRVNATPLTFVDLYTSLRTSHSPAVNESLTAAVQDRLHHLSKTTRILFRWPWLGGPDQNTLHRGPIIDWVNRLTNPDGNAPVIASSIQVGVVQHRVTGAPIVMWQDDALTYRKEILYEARAIELQAMLRRSNAIWEPTDYHYRLPSGEHTGVFIRVADAIQSPQDAYVLAAWLSGLLTNSAGLIVDTSGLTPLLIQLESFLTRFGLAVGPSAILSEYPAGRPTIRRLVNSAVNESTLKLICILSVNSTGSLLRTVRDELEIQTSSTGIPHAFQVLVDHSLSEDCDNEIYRDDAATVWLKKARTLDTGRSSACKLCRSSTRAPFVAIDPRTYGTMSLPGPHLVMPDTQYAMAAQSFWTRVSDKRALAIETNPDPTSRAARGKRTPLAVRPIRNLICQKEGLAELVAERSKNIEIPDEVKDAALVITADSDVTRVRLHPSLGGHQVDLEESLRHVLIGVGLSEDAVIVTMDDHVALRQCLADLVENEAILIFSWGSVTGLTLRQLKTAVADELHRLNVDSPLNALVFHSRPSTPNEWTALENQFRPGRLISLWTSCLPWASPLADEYRLLDDSDHDLIARSVEGRRFLKERLEFLELPSNYAGMKDDWFSRFDSINDGPHPGHIFWGMSRSGIHQATVRGRSLYGQNLDSLTAYAAIGAVINYTRLTARPSAAPRWVMFDMGRIVRSYFDAIITCAMLRWLRPGELWWGTESDEAIRDSVAFLLNQAADQREEQVMLIPEVLLAAAQGKVPPVAHGLVCDLAAAIRESWPDDDRFAMARGAVDVGLGLVNST